MGKFRLEFMNTAYDENGDEVPCDICDRTMKWKPSRRLWTCSDCGREMKRAQFFNYIGADPPSTKCLSSCYENYPLCKRYCPFFDVSDDPDGPMI